MWDPRGFLYVSDEVQNKISRVYPDGRVEPVLFIGDPDGSTLDAQGRLVTTASVLRAIVQVEPGGSYKVLADRYEGKRFNSPNDIVLGPDGALYFTDPNLDLPKGDKQELAFQGVYRLGGGRIGPAADSRSPRNPTGWHSHPMASGCTSTTRRSARSACTTSASAASCRTGACSARRKAAAASRMVCASTSTATCTSPVPAASGSGRPTAGTRGTILLPESAANLAWGDADYRTLYITARTSVYRIRMKSRGFVPGAKR